MATGMTCELGKALSESERSELRAAVERVGEARAHEESGLSRHAIARCVGGMRVQPGTSALARAWLRSQRPAEVRAS
jgi:hypothetical protein